MDCRPDCKTFNCTQKNYEQAGYKSAVNFTLNNDMYTAVRQDKKKMSSWIAL